MILAKALYYSFAVTLLIVGLAIAFFVLYEINFTKFKDIKEFSKKITYVSIYISLTFCASTCILTSLFMMFME